MRGVNGQKKIEEIMAVNFPNLRKDVAVEMQEVTELQIKST